MKRLILFILLIIALGGCGETGSPPIDPTPTPTLVVTPTPILMPTPTPIPTSYLTVINQFTGYTLQDARWVDVSFGEILYGQSKTKTVNPGSDHLFIKILNYWFKTGATITIYSGDNSSFAIDGNTLVTRVSDLTSSDIDQKEVQLKNLVK